MDRIKYMATSRHAARFQCRGEQPLMRWALSARFILIFLSGCLRLFYFDSELKAHAF